MFNWILLFGALLVGTVPAAVWAQAQVGGAATGQKIAASTCLSCHAMSGSGSAASLSRIAQMHSTTSMSLHAFLMTPHANMPNYRLTPDEIDDVVAYILSLRH